MWPITTQNKGKFGIRGTADRRGCGPFFPRRVGDSSTKGGGKRGKCGLFGCIRGCACGCGGFKSIAETAQNRTKTARKVGQTAPSDSLDQTPKGRICGSCGYLYAMGDKTVYASPAAGACPCPGPGRQVSILTAPARAVPCGPGPVRGRLSRHGGRDLKRYAARSRQTGAPFMRIVRLVPPRRWPRGGVWCGGGLVVVRPRRSGPVPPGSRAARKPGARQPPQMRGGQWGRPALWPCRPAGVGSPAAVPGVPAALFPATFCGAPSRARRKMGRAVRPGRRAVVLRGAFRRRLRPGFLRRRGRGTQSAPAASGGRACGRGGFRCLWAAGKDRPTRWAGRGCILIKP